MSTATTAEGERYFGHHEGRGARVRALQTLRASDAACNGVVPGSILADYIDAFSRERGYRPPLPHDPVTRTADAHNEPLLLAAYAAKANRLTARLQECGFESADTVRWTSGLSVHTTDADIERILCWAVAFRDAGATQSEAAAWWYTFTSLHWSLRYRARGHTRDTARDIYWAVASTHSGPRYWTAGLLQQAHAWTMTTLPLNRVKDYIRLLVTPRQALRDWEPRPDCTDAIAVMLALSAGAAP